MNPLFMLLKRLIFKPESERSQKSVFRGTLRTLVITKYGSDHVYYPQMRTGIIGPLLDEYDEVILDLTGLGENAVLMYNKLFLALVTVDKRDAVKVAKQLTLKNDFFPQQAVFLNESIRSLAEGVAVDE